MGLLLQLFSVDELKSLDSKELEVLKAAIQNEIRTSPAVRDAIRENIRQVYRRLKVGD